MRLGFISDLHLEFRDQMFIDKCSTYFNSLNGQIDFLIIAGDIHSDQKKRKRFLESLTVPIKTVMGNHDFFKIELFDDFFDEDGIVGACLWTNYNNNPIDEFNASRNIWDYRYIKDCTTQKCKDLFNIQLKKIMDSPSQIVVTHFTPSHRSITEKFKGDILNTYFCNNLDEMILNSNKKLWIHGHVHSDHNYSIGDCKVVCNPLGYPNELHKLQEVKIIEA